MPEVAKLILIYRTSWESRQRDSNSRFLAEVSGFQDPSTLDSIDQPTQRNTVNHTEKGNFSSAEKESIPVPLCWDVRYTAFQSGKAPTRESVQVSFAISLTSPALHPASPAYHVRRGIHPLHRVHRHAEQLTRADYL
jgi:hypothetical protein